MSLPSTMIRRLIASDRQRAADAVLATVPEPSTVTMCCRPMCTNEIDWQAQRGRPPRFCSKECRWQFAREREKLVDDLAAYTELLDGCPTSWEQQVRLGTRVARIRMQLERYPSFEAPGLPTG